METIKLRAHVGADGILKVELPKILANKETEFVIIYEIDEPQTEDWADFVNRMYGALADDPIERPEQLPLEVRDELE
jgi:hypothetical protein